MDLLITDEVFWATKCSEKLEEKKPLRLDTSVIVDALVFEGIAGVGVVEKPTNILSDWLDTLGPYNGDSFNDGGILRVRVGMIMWVAGEV